MKTFIHSLLLFLLLTSCGPVTRYEKTAYKNEHKLDSLQKIKPDTVKAKKKDYSLFIFVGVTIFFIISYDQK